MRNEDKPQTTYHFLKLIFTPSPSSSTSSPSSPRTRGCGGGLRPVHYSSSAAPSLHISSTVAFPQAAVLHKLCQCGSTGCSPSRTAWWVSHEQKFLTENLLLHGHLYIEPASASAWAAASLGSPPPLAQAHPQGTTWRSALLWYPMGCRGTACSTVGLSTGHRGT